MRFIFCVVFFLMIQGFSQHAPKPDTVKIGAYVFSLHDINFHDKEYTIRFWLWLKYKNPKLSFENTVEVPLAKEIENPDFFSDTLSEEKWQLMKMKCKMKQSWNVSNFPFDKQLLKLSLENSKYDSDRLKFLVDSGGSPYDPELTIDDWKITKFKVFTGQKKYMTDFGDKNVVGEPVTYYDTFNIEMLLTRNTFGLFLKLFFGMYIAFLISSVSFLIDPEHIEPKFGLPVGGLFAAVGNKYIIDSILPETNSFTLVDTLHTITFIYIFIIVTESSIVLILEKRGWRKMAKWMESYGEFIIFTSYFLLNIFFVIKAMIAG